jgi:hypothetical protein
MIDDKTRKEQMAELLIKNRLGLCEKSLRRTPGTSSVANTCNNAKILAIAAQILPIVRNAWCLDPLPVTIPPFGNDG